MPITPSGSSRRSATTTSFLARGPTWPPARSRSTPTIASPAWLTRPTAGQTSIDSFGWTYNAGSLVTSFTSNDGTASYAYDPTNQLTSATYSTNTGGHQPGNESYSYTSNGNRNMTGYSTGYDNLITSDGTFNYSHDADGNQTVRTRISNNYAADYRTTYSWDYRNRLTDVEYFDNNSVLTKHVHFVYDVFNDLIATQVDTTGSGTYDVTQRYVVTGGQPVLEFDNSGNLTQRNLIAPDPAGVDAVMAQGAVTSLDAADVVTWMIDDNEGTPRDVTDNSGTVENHIVYASFGQDVYESDSAYIHWNGFGGSHDDSYTGLNNNGLRWDDPGTGKWLSQDPSGFTAGDTDLSRMIRNSPINAVDPSGLWPIIPDGHAPGYPTDYPYDSPLVPIGDDPDGSWPIANFASMTSMTEEAAQHAASAGCFGLAQITLHMWAPWLVGSQIPMPSMAPGVVFFTSQHFASQYLAQLQANGTPAGAFVYQSTAGPTGMATPGFTPVAPGQMDPAAVPPPGASYNYATYHYSQPYGENYYQYMNNGASEGNQTVTHSTSLPLTNSSGQTFNNYYGVLPQPTLPPPPPGPSLFQRMQTWWQDYVHSWQHYGQY
jgi:RHS repeat-associated protein